MISHMLSNTLSLRTDSFPQTISHSWKKSLRSLISILRILQQNLQQLTETIVTMSFLSLPPKIRDEIYCYIFDAPGYFFRSRSRYRPVHLNVLSASKQINIEALDFLYAKRAVGFNSLDTAAIKALFNEQTTHLIQKIAIHIHINPYSSWDGYRHLGQNCEEFAKKLFHLSHPRRSRRICVS